MPESLRRVQELTGRSLEFEEMDILDRAALERLFKKVGGPRSQAGAPLRAGPCRASSDPACPCSTALRRSSTLRGSKLWESQCRSLWIITELT